MTVDLETKRIPVPVLPIDIDQLPDSVKQYLYDMDNYLQALHRDVQKLGSTP